MNNFTNLTDEAINKLVFEKLYPEYELEELDWMNEGQRSLYFTQTVPKDHRKGHMAPIPDYVGGTYPEYPVFLELKSALDILENFDISLTPITPVLDDGIKWVAFKQPFQCQSWVSTAKRAICECFLRIDELKAVVNE